MKQKLRFYTVLFGLLAISQTVHALFDKTEKKQEINVSCYEYVNNENMQVIGGAGAQVLVQFGSCTNIVSASMGKAGDIISFTAAQLPQTSGVNLFNLGTIPQGGFIEENKIKTPKQGEKVLFNFTSSAGDLANRPIQFLVENVIADKVQKEIRDRGLEQMVADLLVKNPGKTENDLVLFVYYRTLPGIKAGWLDLGQDIGFVDNLTNTFDISVNDKGEVRIIVPESMIWYEKVFNLGTFKLKRRSIQ